jgi:threonine/homoserine/homoserine lactone efflux protein
MLKKCSSDSIYFKKGFKMMAIPNLIVFVLSALVLLIVPGPAVIYIVTRSMAQGRKAGISSVLGIELASMCHSIAAAFGLSAVLLASTIVFNFIKYLGAAYLIYLGVRTLISSKIDVTGIDLYKQSNAQLFRKGFLVNLLNPKTALFFYAFLPQFISPRNGSTIIQILFLGTLFVALATITDSTYALISSSIGRILFKWKNHLKIQRYVTGGIYISLGLATAVSGSGKE